MKKEIPYRTRLKLAAIVSSLFFSIIITFMNVSCVKINAAILNDIALFGEKNKLIGMSVIVILLQALLFVFSYLHFIVNKFICHIFRNKYTNLSLKILFEGDSDSVCAFNKSDITLCSLDLSSDYVAAVFNSYNSFISVIVNLATYILFFRHNISEYIILFIAFVYASTYFISIRLSKKISKNVGEVIDAQIRLNTLTSEFVDNSEYIRLSGIQDTVYDKLNQAMISIKNINEKITNLNIISGVNKIIPQVAVYGTLFAYIYWTIYAGAAIESYFLIMPVVANYISSFEALLGLRQNYLNGCQYEERIIPFLSIESEIIKEEEMHNNIVNILSTDISYKYAGKNTGLAYPDLMENKPSIVLVQGPSGCGKTTLIRILSGLLTPCSGSVKMTDLQKEEFAPGQCRKMIGYNPQMCYLYNSTIRENITLGNKYTDEEIEEALKKACAYDFVKGLPNGIDTILGPGGEGLSGGEKQRISLARALIRKPEILFLDESFSSLDMATGKKIFENLMRENLICFIISHRDDFIYNLDGITKINLCTHFEGGVE
jgi:ABC-type multidrug transport system fused ATPase/permease subunit